MENARRAIVLLSIFGTHEDIVKTIGDASADLGDITTVSLFL
jgi:hypothetical protein